MKKIKLDENFPASCILLFAQAGIDASSVLLQNISGINDDGLYEICTKEGRTLITFDLDFANIIRYPSNATKGIIICRIRKRINIDEIKSLCSTIIKIVKEQELDGNLFIIDDNKVRVRKPEQD